MLFEVRRRRRGFKKKIPAIENQDRIPNRFNLIDERFFPGKTAKGTRNSATRLNLTQYCRGVNDRKRGDFGGSLFCATRERRQHPDEKDKTKERKKLSGHYFNFFKASWAFLAHGD